MIHKKPCPSCWSHVTKRNGHYTNGRQCWLCLKCQKSFHLSNQLNKHNQERIWFERWLKEGYSARQLGQHSGHSITKIYRIINFWLKRKPTTKMGSFENIKHVIFDGTYLHRPISIVALMDADERAIICGAYNVRENSEPQLASFFQTLAIQGLNPRSATIDGNPQVAKVFRLIWPGLVIQRCLVHV